MPPGSSTACSGKQMSFLVENKVTSTGSRSWLGSLGVIDGEWYHSLFHTLLPGPSTLSCVRDSTWETGLEHTAC